MRKIDCHCHGFPQEVLQALAAGGTTFAAVPVSGWDPAGRIEEMRAVDVTFEFLSCPHVYAVDATRLAAACAAVNDRFAETCAAYPQQFGMFAHLPLTDVDASLAELDRALRAGACRGVVLPSNIHGRYLDESEFESLWSEFARRGVPVFVHPVDSPCYRDPEPPTVLSWPFDTTLAATRLITRGHFDRHPGLTLLLSHLGGTLPFLGHRLDIGYGARAAGSPWICERPPSAYLARLFVDTAVGWSRPALDCARAIVGVEHVLFGSDHFNSRLPHMAKIASFIDALDYPEDECALIAHGNAERIFLAQRPGEE